MVSLGRLHLASRAGSAKGFSLIEILMVLVVIGFVTKMVAYSFDGGGRGRTRKTSAQNTYRD